MIICFSSVQANNTSVYTIQYMYTKLLGYVSRPLFINIYQLCREAQALV